MHIPRYKELAVSNFYPKALLDSQLRPYLPERNHLRSSSTPNRQYFYGVLNTLEPQFLKDLVEAGIEKREGSIAEE
jgi:hypothetical protein